MSLFSHWRAWRNRPRVVTGPNGEAVYIGGRTTPLAHWEPPRGYGTSLHPGRRPIVPVDKASTEPATPPWKPPS
jgi:hypothetical protein